MLRPDLWIRNASSNLFAQLATKFPYFRLTSLILAFVLELRLWKQSNDRRDTAKWLTDELPFQAWSLSVPSPLRPEPVYMTYGVWAPPLPIPLRVQFSDKQKHIQALASHFTLCALAWGSAFLEPLACSPKNVSSWLCLLKTGGGGWERHHMWRIRLHLSSFMLSARPLLLKPSLVPVNQPRGQKPPGSNSPVYASLFYPYRLTGIWNTHYIPRSVLLLQSFLLFLLLYTFQFDPHI